MDSIKKFKIINEPRFKLENHDPKFTGEFKNKKEAQEALRHNIEKLKKLQAKLYASGSYSILIVLQAMDAAGKDGIIKHVMTGLNPQGCLVHSFKHPDRNELARNYLWRHVVALPERGMISIFNRSHYENVLICKVHPELVLNEKIPTYNTVESLDQEFWNRRYQQINGFEHFLTQMGTVVVKFFLNISYEEQKRRLLRRLQRKDKQWKFSLSDINERAYWPQYMEAYETAIRNTSTPTAPWYVIPADNKWFSRVAIGEILVQTLEKLEIQPPKPTKAQLTHLEDARKLLEK